VGPLTSAEAAERGAREEWLLELAAAGRAVRMRVAGAERWCAVEDVARLRDALGAEPPPGVPEVFLEAVAAPYANPLIFLFLGGFLLALAMQRWQLPQRSSCISSGGSGRSQ
jgi:hypothetical protein